MEAEAIQEETEQAPVPIEEESVQEETPEQRLQKVLETLPKKKDGSIDYKSMTPQQQFDYTSAAESPEVAIEDLRGDVAAKNEELEKSMLVWQRQPEVNVLSCGILYDLKRKSWTI